MHGTHTRSQNHSFSGLLTGIRGAEEKKPRVERISMPLRETWESDGNQGWKDGVPGSQAPRESRKEEGNTGNKKALPGTRMGSAGRTGRRNKRFGDKKWGFRSVSSTGTPETKRGLPGAKGSTGRPNVWCGGVLLSHTLSGAVPSPCQVLASGFGMGPGVSPGPWPPQILGYRPGNRGFPPACGGSGTGQWTRLLLTDRARVRTVLPVRLRGALPGPAPHASRACGCGLPLDH